MIGRILLKYVPWWVYVPMVAMMMLLVSNQYSDYQNELSALENAKKVGAPAAVHLNTLILPDERRAVHEVSFLGRFKGIFSEIETGRFDHVYALIEPDTKTGASIAVVDVALIGDRLLEKIKGRSEGDYVRLYGFEKRKHHLLEDIRTDLKNSGHKLSGPLYVVEVYWGDRLDAISGQADKSKTLFLVTVGVLISFVCLLLTRVWQTVAVRKKDRVKAKMKSTIKMPADVPVLEVALKKKPKMAVPDKTTPKANSEQVIVRLGRGRK